MAGAVAAKTAAVGGIGNLGGGGVGGGLSGIFNGNSGSQQVYGPAYSYGAAPTVSTALPSPTYYTSQTYVPPQTYAPPPPPPPPQQQPHVVYGVPQQPQPPFNPISAAIQWKTGVVSGLTNGITSGFGNAASIIGLAPPAVAPAYSYAAPAYSSLQVGSVAQAAPVAPPQPIAAPIGPVPNKPVYVVCDSNN